MTRSMEELQEVADPLALEARGARLRYGVTQKIFARMCGLDVKTVHLFETGRRCSVAPSTRSAISALLKQWACNPPEKQPEMRGRWNFARDAVKGGR